MNHEWKETPTNKRLILRKNGIQVEVDLFGATVTSFSVNGQEMLFVSQKALLDGSKAIRGGVPIVFPHFGKVAHSDMPQHGFARVSKWEWLGIVSENDSCLSAQLGLNPECVPAALKALWPHSNTFQVIQTVSLGYDANKPWLEIQLTVKNKGTSAFEITPLLHTYLLVKEIGQLKVQGFKGLSFVDKLVDASVQTETREDVTIAQEVDRIYQNVTKDLTVMGTGCNKSVTVRIKGFEDAVLWNPWIEKSKAMADFDDAEYHHMVCVEPGSVTRPVSVLPGSSWQGSQTLIIDM